MHIHQLFAATFRYQFPVDLNGWMLSGRVYQRKFCNGFNFTLASVQLGNVEQCEVLLKQKRPQTLIELIEIWQALSTVHG